MWVCRSFMMRLNLMDPKQVVLIECKFELTYRRFLTEKGNPAPFINHVSLKLVRPEVAYLKFGLVVRHIIDEESPLYGMDLEVLPKPLTILLLNSISFGFSVAISFVTFWNDFISRNCDFYSHEILHENLNLTLGNMICCFIFVTLYIQHLHVLSSVANYVTRHVSQNIFSGT